MLAVRENKERWDGGGDGTVGRVERLSFGVGGNSGSSEVAMSGLLVEMSGLIASVLGVLTARENMERCVGPMAQMAGITGLKGPGAIIPDIIGEIAISASVSGDAVPLLLCWSLGAAMYGIRVFGSTLPMAHRTSFSVTSRRPDMEIGSGALPWLLS